MTRIRHINTPDSPAPSGSYSQARVSNGMLFLAGVGPYDPQTRQVVGSTIAEQTERVLENIRAVLRAAGSDLTDVVSTTAYLADLERDWSEFDATYGRFFCPPFPARTAIGAKLKNVLVEVAVVAELEPAAANSGLVGTQSAGVAGGDVDTGACAGGEQPGPNGP